VTDGVRQRKQLALDTSPLTAAMAILGWLMALAFAVGWIMLRTGVLVLPPPLPRHTPTEPPAIFLTPIMDAVGDAFQFCVIPVWLFYVLVRAKLKMWKLVFGVLFLDFALSSIAHWLSLPRSLDVTRHLLSEAVNISMLLAVIVWVPLWFRSKVRHV